MSVKTLHDLVVSADKYKRYSRVTEAMIASQDLKALSEEVDKMHKIRSDRNQHINVSVKRLIKLNMEDQAFRSRIIHVVMSVRKVYDILEFAASTIEAWIMSQYRAHLTGSWADRNAVACRFTVSARQHLVGMSSLLEFCDQAIKDIDSASWRYKAILTAMELNSRPEMRI